MTRKEVLYKGSGHILSSSKRPPKRPSEPPHQESREPVSTSDALENVLSHVGAMGLYQKLLFLTMLPFGFFLPYVYFVQMFITATPQSHWCHVPELAHLSKRDRRRLITPAAIKVGTWERCHTYDVDWNTVLKNMKPPPENTPIIPCQHGWEFDLHDIPYPTIVSERGWVCDHSKYIPIAQAVFFGGAFLGGLVLGWLADNYGRVPAIVASNLIGAVAGIATIYTSGVWDFIICRFFVGMAYDNCFLMLYILVLEYVGPNYRTIVANMSMALFFGGGCITLPWLALWISNWRRLLWVTSGPMFLALLVPLFIPESARWLVSKGKITKAVKMLRKFEKVNGTKIPDDVMEEFMVSTDIITTENESLRMLIMNRPYRFTLLILMLVHITTCIMFDGLVRLSETLGLDFFVTFFVASMTEIPSVTLLAFMLDRYGRRNITFIPVALSGVLSLISMFVPFGIPQATVIVISRFFINMSFNTVIQWITEILPTEPRASGSASIHMCGYIGTTLSPFIIYSERLWMPLPLLILGLIGLAASALTLLLPETMGRPMPQTIADGERLIKEGRICVKSEMQEPKDVKKLAII